VSGPLTLKPKNLKKFFKNLGFLQPWGWVYVSWRRHVRSSCTSRQCGRLCRLIAAPTTAQLTGIQLTRPQSWQNRFSLVFSRRSNTKMSSWHRVAQPYGRQRTCVILMPYGSLIWRGAMSTRTLLYIQQPSSHQTLSTAAVSHYGLSTVITLWDSTTAMHYLQEQTLDKIQRVVCRELCCTSWYSLDRDVTTWHIMHCSETVFTAVNDWRSHYVCSSVSHFTDWHQVKLMACWFQFQVSDHTPVCGRARRPCCSWSTTTSSKADFCCWSNCMEQLADPRSDIRYTDNVQESPQDSLNYCGCCAVGLHLTLLGTLVVIMPFAALQRPILYLVTSLLARALQPLSDPYSQSTCLCVQLWC